MVECQVVKLPEEGQETEAQNAWVLHTKPAIWNGANLVIFNGGFMPVAASRGFVG